MVDNPFHPAHFASKKTINAQRKYTNYEFEGLAVINALQKISGYVLGIPFNIVTNCNSFKMTNNGDERHEDKNTQVGFYAI